MTEDKIPDFLNRKINPYKEPSKLALAICALSHEEAQLVWRKMQEKNIKFKAPKGVKEPKHLLYALAKANAGQVEVIMSVIREHGVVATATIEKMLGHPITRLAERSVTKGGRPSHKVAASGAKATKFDATDTIKITVDANPKKKGGDPWRRFELYRNGMSVKEALAAGIFEADIAWDLKHKFIAMEKP